MIQFKQNMTKRNSDCFKIKIVFLDIQFNLNGIERNGIPIASKSNENCQHHHIQFNHQGRSELTSRNGPPILRSYCSQFFF